MIKKLVNYAMGFKNIKYFEKVSVELGFRKKGEDPGFDLRLNNGLYLEVKIMDLKVLTFDVMLYYDILNGQPLSTKKEFDILRKKLQKEFNKNYENLLFKSYIHFYNELKNLEGMFRKKDMYSQINLSIKKGVINQALFRLVMVIDKKPYTFDKWISQTVSKTRHWKILLKFVRWLDRLDSYEDLLRLKKFIRDYIDAEMPKRSYIGAWWKHLRRYKEQI